MTHTDISASGIAVPQGRVDENIDRFSGRYRVRVRRNGRVLSKLFQCLDEAQQWRDDIRGKHPAPIRQGLRCKAQPSKQSGLPVGVSRTRTRDRRKADDPVYVAYSVYWKDDGGRARIKAFHAGRESDLDHAEDLHARETAIAFRAAYEWCVRTGWHFHPEWFSAWRDLRCYPFRPPNADSRDCAEVLIARATQMPSEALNAELGRIFGWRATA